MFCLNPLQAWFRVNDNGLCEGKPFFSDTLRVDLEHIGDSYRRFPVSCGYCLPCLLKKRAQNTFLTHSELAYSGPSTFLTLTYNDEYLPPNGQLNYADLSFFFKELKRYLRRKGLYHNFAYTYSGEYGAKSKRPHYHVLLYGVDFLDLLGAKHIKSNYYSSKLIERFWKFGFNLFSTAEAQHCAYAVGYTVKKCISLVDNSAGNMDVLKKVHFAHRHARKTRKYEFLESLICGKEISKFNKIKGRRVVNSNFPCGRCFKRNGLYFPAEKVYLGRLGDKFYKDNNEFMFDDNYVVDPLTRLKYAVPLKFVNKLKDLDFSKYRQFKVNKYLYAFGVKDVTESDKSFLLHDLIKTNISERPLDSETQGDVMPADVEVLNDFEEEFCGE